MSWRHTHVTSNLATETEHDIRAFITAARAVDSDFFTFVEPVTVVGRIVAVAMGSKDLDAISDELDMPGVAGQLAGILASDIEIVSAWDGHHHADCERVWQIPGRDYGTMGRN